MRTLFILLLLFLYFVNYSKSKETEIGADIRSLVIRESAKQVVFPIIKNAEDVVFTVLAPRNECLTDHRDDNTVLISLPNCDFLVSWEKKFVFVQFFTFDTRVHLFKILNVADNITFHLGNISSIQEETQRDLVCRVWESDSNITISKIHLKCGLQLVFEKSRIFPSGYFEEMIATVTSIIIGATDYSASTSTVDYNLSSKPKETEIGADIRRLVIRKSAKQVVFPIIKNAEDVVFTILAPRNECLTDRRDDNTVLISLPNCNVVVSWIKLFTYVQFFTFDTRAHLFKIFNVADNITFHLGNISSIQEETQRDLVCRVWESNSNVMISKTHSKCGIRFVFEKSRILPSDYFGEIISTVTSIIIGATDYSTSTLPMILTTNHPIATSTVDYNLSSKLIEIGADRKQLFLKAGKNFIFPIIKNAEDVVFTVLAPRNECLTDHRDDNTVLITLPNCNVVVSWEKKFTYLQFFTFDTGAQLFNIFYAVDNMTFHLSNISSIQEKTHPDLVCRVWESNSNVTINKIHAKCGMQFVFEKSRILPSDYFEEMISTKRSTLTLSDVDEVFSSYSISSDQETQTQAPTNGGLKGFLLIAIIGMVGVVIGTIIGGIFLWRGRVASELP